MFETYVIGAKFNKSIYNSKKSPKPHGLSDFFEESYLSPLSYIFMFICEKIYFLLFLIKTLSQS